MRSAGRALLMAVMFLPFLDTQLVERASQGNQDAFNQLAATCHAPLLQYCLSYLRDYDLADEAAQLTLIQIYHKLPSLRDPQAFPAWIQRIASNQCIDIIRSSSAAHVQNSAAIESVSSSGTPGAEDAFIEQGASHQFIQLLSGLSKKLRDTLLFFYVYGHPVESIGDYLNIPPETVRKRLFDARRSLGKQLAGGQEEVDTLLADLGRSHSAPLRTALTALAARQDSFALFAEGFEQGAVDTSIWTPVAGTPEVTDQRAHSGKYAYHIKPSHYDMIRQVFPERMVGSVSVWIYDDVSKPLATLGIISVLGGGPIDTNLRLGVFEEWAGSHYLFQISNRGDRRHKRSTSLHRTTGWHQFQFVVDGRMTHACAGMVQKQARQGKSRHRARGGARPRRPNRRALVGWVDRDRPPRGSRGGATGPASSAHRPVGGPAAGPGEPSPAFSTALGRGSVVWPEASAAPVSRRWSWCCADRRVIGC